ncbi:hypothetical protein [Xanthomonas translucens]|uniref:hypothetical protein n=1 Tax=Xanthomonas campestris pv. translucens TaxID=343 RepID=UPI000AF27307|nr:hypothetical protein [Xanthomonas translucens]UPU50480.1 hypothetical protein MZO50_08960 [Xanthomonas translucens pv. undulosa]WLA03832.1 hypothetical protein MO329_14365 [Xanthomonas translucens]
MIKVNQVTKQAEIDRLNRADILGFCLAKGRLEVEDFAKLRIIHQKSSVAAAPDSGWTLEDLAGLVSEISADYFEFTPSEPEKKAELAEELRILAQVDRPKIANGFFVLADDDSFLKMEDYFENLRRHGVELFQFEIVSWVEDNTMLSKSLSARVDRFFASFPCLVSDDFSTLSKYPSVNAKGFYLNLDNGGGNYDFSEYRFTFSRVLSLMRSLS